VPNASRPPVSAADIGARTYSSVVSILRDNLDRADRPQPVPDLPPLQHANIRGGAIINSDDNPTMRNSASRIGWPFWSTARCWNNRRLKA
jgi:hypothetical protein